MPATISFQRLRQMRARQLLRGALAACLIAPALGACTPLGMAIGGAASLGSAAIQERSLSEASSDLDIKLGINDRLFKTDSDLYTDVSATVVEGRVLLTGLVPKQADREQAEHLTWTVPGVREVLNELEVTRESEDFQFVKDEWIAAKLRARLFGDFDISDVNYDIDVTNGVVYLMGIGQDQFEIDRTAAHAQEIDGVRRVVVYALAADDPRRMAETVRPDGAPAPVPFERQAAGERTGTTIRDESNTRDYSLFGGGSDEPQTTASITSEPLPPVR